MRKITVPQSPNLLINNQAFHQMLTEGIDVPVQQADGSYKTEKAWPIDFKVPENNDWLALNQFTVIENGVEKRPDLVVFVNGMPLVVIELKSASNEEGGHHQGIQPDPNLQEDGSLPVYIQCLLGDQRRRQCPGRFPYRQRGPLYDVADDRRGGSGPGGDAPAGSAAERDVGKRAVSGSSPPFHPFSDGWGADLQDLGRLSPVSMQPTKRWSGPWKRRQKRGPQDRGNLAYPGVRQKFVHGVLCGQAGSELDNPTIVVDH